jgi:hypothetical protein
MKFALGNEKLGKTVVVSRPVGLSCPPDCFFLNNGCYAQATEKRFQNARIAAMHNMKVLKSDIVDIIELAKKKLLAIRAHERGDFGVMRDGKFFLDKNYVLAWERALKSFDELPPIWAYTHIYEARLAKMKGIKMYASVHTKDDIRKAKKAGFKSFAFCSEIKKKPGGSKEQDAWIDVPLLGRTFVCPEQRMGRKQVTCKTCQWCHKGKNVVFLNH